MFPINNSKNYDYIFHSTGAHSFGSLRDNERAHAGIDLYGDCGDVVYNMFSDGEVIRIASFYRGSYAIEVSYASKGLTVRYCEVTPCTEIIVGSKIVEGYNIGTIALLNGLDKSMLHIEMYNGCRIWNLTDTRIKPYLRHKSLIDPTNILKAEYEKK